MDRNNFLGRAVALVVTALFIIGLTAFILMDAPREEQLDPRLLTLNTANTVQMHKYGLPTKTDVIEWHMHGRWAYIANGRSFVYADLPGGSTVWDDLYRIDENPVFKK